VCPGSPRVCPRASRRAGSGGAAAAPRLEPLVTGHRPRPGRTRCRRPAGGWPTVATATRVRCCARRRRTRPRRPRGGARGVTTAGRGGPAVGAAAPARRRGGRRGGGRGGSSTATVATALPSGVGRRRGRRRGVFATGVPAVDRGCARRTAEGAPRGSHPVRSVTERRRVRLPVCHPPTCTRCCSLPAIGRPPLLHQEPLHAQRHARAPPKYATGPSPPRPSKTPVRAPCTATSSSSPPRSAPPPPPPTPRGRPVCRRAVARRRTPRPR